MPEYLTKDYTITAEEVAELLSYNIQYVRILARTGKLPALKRGRVWMFCEAEIWDFLERYTHEEIEEYRRKITKLMNSKEANEKRGDR